MQISFIQLIHLERLLTSVKPSVSEQTIVGDKHFSTYFTSQIFLTFVSHHMSCKESAELINFRECKIFNHS